MTAVVLMPLAAGDAIRYASLASTLALLTGAICVLGRLLRLGFLADLLSKPVLIGYLTGVAVIMIVGQLRTSWARSLRSPGRSIRFGGRPSSCPRRWC